MITVTVSQKFQVVVPKVVRKNLGIMPGQKLQILEFPNRIELISLKKIRDTKGDNDNK